MGIVSGYRRGVRSKTSLLLLLSCLAAPLRATAGEADVAQAEYHRLSSEIRSLAKRDHWVGVDHAYVEALATGVSLAFGDHMAGASAAMAIGDVGAARERLLAAKDVEVQREVIETLWSIDTHFAEVDLTAERGAELCIEEMPFNPQQANAVEFAQERIRETGVFHGFLPPGRYTLAGTSFTVEVVGVGGRPLEVTASRR